MGYRSEVFFKAHFNNSADRDAVIARLPEDRQTRVRDNAVIPEDRPVVFFYHPHIKWYTATEVLGTTFAFPDVDALDTLVGLCRSAAEAGDDEYYIPNSGVFCRVGEESDDNEEYFWQPRTQDQGALPYPWDMAGIQRSIRFDEDECSFPVVH